MHLDLVVIFFKYPWGKGDMYGPDVDMLIVVLEKKASLESLHSEIETRISFMRNLSARLASYAAHFTR